MDRIELLSPAGDLERLKVTLTYGADAVYIGEQKEDLRVFDIEKYIYGLFKNMEEENE